MKWKNIARLVGQNGLVRSAHTISDCTRISFGEKKPRSRFRLLVQCREQENVMNVLMR